MTNETKILSADEFDTGTSTAAPDIAARMKRIADTASRFGLNLQALSDVSGQSSPEDAESSMAELHDASAILFVQWERSRQAGDNVGALATARLFNGLTRRARDLDIHYDLIDKGHIQTLVDSFCQQHTSDTFEPKDAAQALNQAAMERTHERAWPWVVLPTFPRQPYGRILLSSIRLDDAGCWLFITQPFFLSGKCTLFHTHGQNWAVSRPLGNGADTNAHLNTMWTPRTATAPYPLVQVGHAEYTNDTVVIIPPRTIHGISRKRTPARDIPPLKELLNDRARRDQWIAETRFGEKASLHVYHPHKSLVETLANSPILKEDERFFIEHDMIVFDHHAQSIWAGGGGSWPKRMIEFGPTGEHCHLCFEDDPRRENLDPQIVHDWLLESPPPDVSAFSFNEITR